jgi:mono/diheme cytochrome c family protein
LEVARMKLRSRWLVALYAAGAAALAASAAPPAEDRSEARFRHLMLGLGKQEFASYCAVCHGPDGRGGGPAARALVMPPSDLTRIAARRGGKFPHDEIAQKIDGRFEVIAHGSREMPVWGVHLADRIAEDASGDEVARGRIDLLVEYLLSIQADGTVKP